MKHFYSGPELKIVKLGKEDVITTSGVQDETKGSTFQSDVFGESWD